MVTATRKERLPDHFRLSMDFADSALTFLVDDFRVDGTHEDLARAIDFVVAYVGQHVDREWPGSATRFLNLVGELSVVSLCESRNPCAYAALRNLLQALYDELLCEHSNRPTNCRERAQHELDLKLIAAGAAEIDFRALFMQTTTIPQGDQR